MDKAFGISWDEYDLYQPQAFLHEYGLTRHVPLLDMLPLITANSASGDFYLERDTHYNDSGNRLTADALFRFFVTNAFLTSRTGH